MHLILYDGVCGLCNRLVRFLLARDRRDQFRFAALQGPTAREVLRRYHRAAEGQDTFYLIADYGEPRERLLAKSRAVLFVLRALGGGWLCTIPLGIVPTFLLDAGYDFIARRRYGLFGRYHRCPLPDPAHQRKFLDEPDAANPPGA